MQGISVSKGLNQVHSLNTSPTRYLQLGIVAVVVVLDREDTNWDRTFALLVNNQFTEMKEEEKLQDLNHTTQNPAHKFRTLDNILEDEAHYNNVIRTKNQGKVLIKLLRYGFLMGPQVNTFRELTYMEYQKSASAEIQDKYLIVWTLPLTPC